MSSPPVVSSPSDGRNDAHTIPARRGELPPVKEWKLRFFTAYTLRHVQKHFHAVRLSRAGYQPEKLTAPTVVYLNHASWWDPLASVVLMAKLFPHQRAFAPIEARQLERYGILQNIGLFGVEPGTSRGALRFLRTARNVLHHPGAMLWITPQGRFVDPRERPVMFEDGLAHVAMRERDAVFLPLAIEMPFWKDSRPEMLVRFGTPVTASQLPDASAGVEAHSRFLAARLTETQEQLAREAIAQDPAAFRTLLGGSAGVGGVYDRWRALKARWRGETFVAEHGGAVA